VTHHCKLKLRVSEPIFLRKKTLSQVQMSDVASPTSRNSENPTKKAAPAASSSSSASQSLLLWFANENHCSKWRGLLTGGLSRHSFEFFARMNVRVGEWRRWRNWFMKTKTWIRARSTTIHLLQNPSTRQWPSVLLPLHMSRLSFFGIIAQLKDSPNWEWTLSTAPSSRVTVPV